MFSMKKIFLTELADTFLNQFCLLAQRKSDFDVQHIKIDLSFNWTKRQAKGAPAIELLPGQPTNKILLDVAKSFEHRH